MFCTKFHAVTKRSQMHPNTMKCSETLVLGPMGWIGCVLCEKLQYDFMARTFALIAPVQYVLQQVSCSYETMQMHPNTTKYTETLVLGPMGWISAFFAKNYKMTSSHELLHYFLQFTPFCTEFQTVTKRSQMHPNTMKHTRT